VKKTLSVIAGVVFVGSLLTACDPGLTCAAGENKIDRGHQVTTMRTTTDYTYVGTGSKRTRISHTSTVPYTYWDSHWVCEKK